MSGASHIVKRQLLELRGVRKAEATERQNQLKQLYYQQLLPLIDQYLSKWNSNGAQVRIDRLVLDLGVIKTNHFKSDFIRQFERELVQQLEAMTKESLAEEVETPTVSTDVDAARSDLELIDFFVQTGNLPWWVQASAGNRIETAFRKAIEDHPGQLIAQLSNWIKQENYTRRIIRQLSTDTLEQLIQLSTSGHAISFQSAFNDFLLLLEPISVIWSKSTHHLKEESYLRLFSLLFSEKQPLASRIHLWEALMLQLAQAFRQPYAAWLELLQEMIQEVQLSGKLLRSPFIEIREQLFSLIADRRAQAFDIGTREESQLDWKDDELWNKWLRERGMDAAHGGQLHWLQKLSKDQSLSKKLRLQLDQLPFGKAWSDWKVAERRELARLIGHLDKRKPANSPAHKSKAGKPKITSAFSAAEETFINNAGLVILWPYLPRLFSSLSLVEGKRFVSPTAAHRATGILQYLADGQADISEYLLGFNKVLCGLAWDELLDFGEAVTVVEAKECDTFLNAVIANAPVLKNMTVDGFRGSFLLRKGMLKPGAEAWELHVEAAPYDIVLEQFPWSWPIVKLPWLAKPILVEWPTTM